MNPIIKEWHITRFGGKDGAYYIFGTVFGHTSAICTDGTYIHTSAIEKITPSAEDTLDIQTQNTLYSVKLRDYGSLVKSDDPADGYVFSMTNGDYTADALEYFNIPTEVYAVMTAYRKERFDKRQELIESCKAKLLPNELYLALSDLADRYFDFGILNSDETVLLDIIIRIGRFQDSVLVRGKECETAVRYFPYKTNKIKFYESLYHSTPKLSKGTRMGYIRNTGHAPLNISFTWGKTITLSANEEIEVLYQESGHDDVYLTDKTDMHPAIHFYPDKQ